MDEHHYGAIWGGIPLIPVDVFEHAYYHKDGPKRAAYIDNFIAQPALGPHQRPLREVREVDRHT